MSAPPVSAVNLPASPRLLGPLLPRLPRAGESRGDISPAQSRWMVAGIVAAHVAGAWGLLQISAVREAVLQAAPMFVDLIPPADQPAPPKPALPPPPKPVPDLRKPPPPEPLIAAAPSPAPAPFVVPAPPPPEPAPARTPAPAVVTQAVTAAPAQATPPPAPSPPAAPPKPMVATAAQFLEQPELIYPRLSSKNNEQGRGMVLATVSVQGGPPRSVRIAQGSGFARLDDAALNAVQKSRFKPLVQAATDTPRATEFSVLVPFNFELEK